MSIPIPAPPVQRFVPALVAVNSRRGITVVIDRQPNLCRWAVHTTANSGRPITITGPRAGEPNNPSNSELGAQITAAVKTTGVEVGDVFAADYPTAELLRKKTTLPISNLCPPSEALAAAKDGIASVEARLVTGLTLACDASRGKGTNINGCGWVLSYKTGNEPVIGTYTSVAEYGGIRAGELAAIRRGLQSTLNLHPALRDGVGSIKVLTDSRAALDLLERVQTGDVSRADDSDSLDECRRILGSSRGMNIAFEWVRGHDGHPLNELADRLAVLARRNREMGVDEVTNARMVAALRTDAKVACTA